MLRADAYGADVCSCSFHEHITHEDSSLSIYSACIRELSAIYC